MLAICDELLGVGRRSPPAAPTAFIERRDAVVLDWATETFEGH